MKEHARIGHLTVCRHLDEMSLGAHAVIGHLNWITGYPTSSAEPMFGHRSGRRPELTIAEHAAITSRHYVDCTDSIRIGRFSVLAGCRSVLMSHSVDVRASRQDCGPITIGDYCFVGTNCVLLAGSSLPDRSVLGAMSLLNRRLADSHRVYAGNPAREVGTIDEGALYFHRTLGRVE